MMSNHPNATVDYAIVKPKSEDLINNVIDEIRDMLMEKNRKYGDSALNPTRIFAKSDSIEQIRVRIDDKLSRLRNLQDDEDEDIILDLMGYLVLLRVATLKERDEQPDFETETFDLGEWNKTMEKNIFPWNPSPQPWQYQTDYHYTIGNVSLHNGQHYDCGQCGTACW